ncbi:uncharacterized protein TRUGW13939_08836 [Talaromyces rugulosus]|uniref:BZIP domain-containing protein n=1 Tax=Talaromyces rugulosus TaxID=121627 RepID=A0A7H8R5N4_TALRU|nr:uncharacterized protein TRUGW13939_08836 [Talaromyces rugulosus]QKX61682.1 hypothetical protein TRUGW13939_08836 [Talaromyces rugulosus]
MHHWGNSYGYPYPVTTTTTTTTNTPSKYQSSSHMHGTSSAFSANANPNEDWTKISDLAERRRIQNRIAQRNYRKKLKRRLEDLERRAASSSASPEQSHAEPEQPKPASKSQSASSSTSSARSKQSSKANNHWSAPENEMGMQPGAAYGGMQEDRGMFGQQSTRQLSTSPPPFFYPSYPSYSDPYGQSNYSSQPAHPHHSYHTIPQAQYGDLASLPAHHMDQMPHTLPSGTSASKRLGGYPDDEVLNPLCINYASMAGIDMSTTTPQQQQQQHHRHHSHSHHSHLQTPPLTNSYTFNNSGSTSPAGSLNDHFPLTPEPARLSPEHIVFL